MTDDSKIMKDLNGHDELLWSAVIRRVRVVTLALTFLANMAAFAAIAGWYAPAINERIARIEAKVVENVAHVAATRESLPAWS
jgi:hypothetical protein